MDEISIHVKALLRDYNLIKYYNAMLLSSPFEIEKMWIDKIMKYHLENKPYSFLLIKSTAGKTSTNTITQQWKRIFYFLNHVISFKNL